MARLYLIHAAIALIPVLVLGMALAARYRQDADRRNHAEAEADARLIAQTAILPLFSAHPHPLSQPLTPEEAQGLGYVVGQVGEKADVRALKIRDEKGKVVFPVGEPAT